MQTFVLNDDFISCSHKKLFQDNSLTCLAGVDGNHPAQSLLSPLQSVSSFKDSLPYLRLHLTTCSLLTSCPFSLSLLGPTLLSTDISCLSRSTHSRQGPLLSSTSIQHVSRLQKATPINQIRTSTVVMGGMVSHVKRCLNPAMPNPRVGN